MEYSGAGGKLVHEKNLKQKISWHCPFKPERRGEGQQGRVQITKLGWLVRKKLAIFSLQTLCAELGKMPLITFWSKSLGDDDE